MLHHNAPHSAVEQLQGRNNYIGVRFHSSYYPPLQPAPEPSLSYHAEPVKAATDSKKESATDRQDLYFSSNVPYRLLHTRVAIAASTALCIVQFYYLFKVNLFISCNYHLRNTFTSVNNKIGI